MNVNVQLLEAGRLAIAEELQTILNDIDSGELEATMFGRASIIREYEDKMDDIDTCLRYGEWAWSEGDF